MTRCFALFVTCIVLLFNRFVLICNSVSRILLSSQLIIDLKPEDPEFKWKICKEQKGLVSSSMDKLMALTGMKEIKTQVLFASGLYVCAVNDPC